MNMNRFLPFAIVVALLWSITPAQAEPDPTVQAIFKNLMAAVVADDHDKFLVDCNDVMKEMLTPEKLTSVSGQIAPRAKGGYASDYLSELNQRGYTVHLWRLRFKDGGDDILATLSMKDGKVGGFFLH